MAAISRTPRDIAYGVESSSVKLVGRFSADLSLRPRGKLDRVDAAKIVTGVGTLLRGG